METELWKPIKGYEGLYEVSNMGRIKSVEHDVFNPHVLGNGCTRKVPERIRKPNIMKGYHCIALIRDKSAKVYRIHRLVAEAFIGNQPGPEYQINHIDGDKSNNRVENLEWVTPRENTIHAIRTGLIKPKSEEQKKQFSEYLRRKWKDSEYRKAQSERISAVWKGPERRKQRTEMIVNGIHNSNAERYVQNRKETDNAQEKLKR